MSSTAVDPARQLTIVDFHNHYLGPAFALALPKGLPPAQRPYWEGVNRRLADPDALISSIDSGGVAARVVSAPLEFLEGGDGDVPADTIARLNDDIAGLVREHPRRLYGLATVDAYRGEAAARELTRAVKDLGLRGVFVESARGDLLPDASEARPTFATAAALGVPVFLHPVPDPPLSIRFKRYGRLGLRLARGTINSAALFALFESGMFEEFPNLRVVVTALALGGLVLAGDGARLTKKTPAPTRRHVYLDTTGLDPLTLRIAVDLLGPDHVLMGTDWPVVVETSLAERTPAALAACGLDVEEQRMIAGGNTLRLLGVG